MVGIAFHRVPTRPNGCTLWRCNAGDILRVCARFVNRKGSGFHVHIPAALEMRIGGGSSGSGMVPRVSGERLVWRAGIVEAQFATLRGLFDALPADARPWRWSIADEPPPEALPALRQLADRCKAAGIPTVCVAEPYCIERAAAAVHTVRSTDARRV